jgi:hypothetical protein
MGYVPSVPGFTSYKNKEGYAERSMTYRWNFSRIILTSPA